MIKALYLQFFFGGLVSLLVITNPLSKIPLFVSLTQGMSELRRAHQARMACVYAAAIMLVSLLAG
ncbi:MAG: stress protection protein MarC, partial [Vogesella sp.]|nr:stress protection protein MarC [Vogesella sp.]